MTPVILQCGHCERIKTATHSVVMVTAAVCGLYNLAAWLVRRQRHLAINTTVYSALVIWEFEHVRHHLVALARAEARAMPVSKEERAA
jgi:hypothetical protein